MPNDDYISGLDGTQIENALEAIHGVVTSGNNGKVLAVEDGAIVAKSASEYTDAPVLAPLSATENGDYLPPSGVDGFNSVHVARAVSFGKVFKYKFIRAFHIHRFSFISSV